LYRRSLNVGVGLFCSLALTIVGLIFIVFGKLLIHDTQSDLGADGRRFLTPFLEKITKYDFTLNAREVRRFEISAFSPIVTLFLASWASLAYGFARLYPAAYDHPERLTFWLMCKHYLWQLVDMVPLVDAWKNVHVEDPVLEHSLWPGLLVIVFRLIILYVVLSAAARLFGFDKRKMARD